MTEAEVRSLNLEAVLQQLSLGGAAAGRGDQLPAAALEPQGAGVKQGQVEDLMSVQDQAQTLGSGGAAKEHAGGAGARGEAAGVAAQAQDDSKALMSLWAEMQAAGKQDVLRNAKALLESLNLLNGDMAGGGLAGGGGTVGGPQLVADVDVNMHRSTSFDK